MKVENINNKILEQIKEEYPDLWRKANNKYSKLDDWLLGKDSPTYNQLVKLSKIFHIPFGYFFLEKLPEEQKLPIPHFRTINNSPFQPSTELRDTILFAQKIQEWARDILIELGNQPLSFCGKYTIQNSIDDIVNELKNILNIKVGWASDIDTWSTAFNYLKQKTEEAGILVLINGIVENNTHRKLSLEEFRGFVLYDNIAPVIFINNNDTLSAKIFTLIHEIVHVLIGQSASFDLQNLQSSDNEIEKFCDKCTAEFLVPKNQLRELYSTQHDIEQLAKRFKVSQIVILRRLFDLGIIGRNQFFEKFNQLYKSETFREKSKGGNFYSIEQNRLSRYFISLLQSAVNNNIIQLGDVLRVTNLKAKTYEKLIANGMV